MYWISRLLLMISVLLLAYSTILLCLIAGWLGWVGLGLLLMLICKRKRRALSALGSASWAGESELRGAGMLSAKCALILGRLGARDNIVERLKGLFRLSIRARDACDKLLGRMGSDLVRLRDPATVAVFAPTGTGKGASLAIPFLLSCPDSCVVIDFKGELAFRTALTRRRMGHEIVILDPFKVVTS